MIIIDEKEIYKSNKFTCFELMIMQVCSHLQIDFWKMFAWRITFGYQKLLINNRKYFPIYFEKNYDKEFEFLKKYLGLEINIYDFYNEELKRIIYKELEENHPIGMLIDTYFCPWNQAYQKEHLPHFCLIIGYDYENYYICDTYSVSGKLDIAKDQIDKNLIKKYLLFSKTSIKKYNFFELISEGIAYGNSYNIINDYAQELITCSLSNVVLKKELEDIKMSSTLRNMKFYVDARSGFYELLLRHKDILPINVIDSFNEIKIKWLQCLYTFIYILMQNNDKSMEEIGQILLEISTQEKIFFNNLLSYLIEQGKM